MRGAMMLVLLPSADYDPTESAVPWAALRAAGLDVRFATPDGAPAFADQRLVERGFGPLSPLLMTRAEPLDTTALTASMELSAWAITRVWLGSYYRTYPQTVQAEVTAALASERDFLPGPRLARRDSADALGRGFVVRDGAYLSARWPGDSHRFAAELVDVASSSGAVPHATPQPSA